MERELLHRLLSQAFLYEDPHAYKAGVQAAWGVLTVLRATEMPTPATLQPSSLQATALQSSPLRPQVSSAS